VRNNPINFVDPTGHITEKEANEADDIVQRLKSYHVTIEKDWGYPGGVTSWNVWYNDPVDSSRSGIRTVCNEWEEGLWQLSELRDVDAGVGIMIRGIRHLGGDLRSLAGSATIQRESGTLPSALGNVINYRVDNASQRYRLYAVIHEMGHVITYNQPATMTYFMSELGSVCIDGSTNFGIVYCNEEKGTGTNDPGDYAGSNYEHMPSSYSRIGNWEDFSDSFSICVYPGFKGAPPLIQYPIRKDYIEGLLNGNKCSQ
jgi:hypothetical protein